LITRSTITRLTPPQIVPDRKVTDPSKQANDPQLAENLWKLTEEILTSRLGSLPYQTNYA